MPTKRLPTPTSWPRQILLCNLAAASNDETLSLQTRYHLLLVLEQYFSEEKTLIEAEYRSPEIPI
jgi:hypothetical protein